MEKISAFLKQAKTSNHHNTRPLVSLCYAQSLDGSITARRGQPTAISGPQSGRLTHQLRAAHDAILVGVGTVLADKPRLTVRLAGGQDPQPVILDSRLRTPPNSFLLRQHPSPAWIATSQSGDSPAGRALLKAGARLLVLPGDLAGRVELPVLLDELGAAGVKSLMVEGGAQVIASFLAQRLADLLILTIAPLFVGGLRIGQDGVTLPGAHTGAPFPRLEEVDYDRLGDDLIVWGRIDYGSRPAA